LRSVDAAGRRVRPAVRTSKLHMLPGMRRHDPLRYGSLPARVKPAPDAVDALGPCAAESRKLTVFLRVPAKTRPSLLSSIIARC
jgi:hypothetical protein